MAAGRDQGQGQAGASVLVHGGGWVVGSRSKRPHGPGGTGDRGWAGTGWAGTSGVGEVRGSVNGGMESGIQAQAG